jgi:hypothetical protein
MKTSIRSTFIKTVAIVALTGALAVTGSGAQAKSFGHHGWGRGLGIGLGVGLLGAAIASSASADRVCHVERRFDEYGNYIGRVRVCE